MVAAVEKCGSSFFHYYYYRSLYASLPDEPRPVPRREWKWAAAAAADECFDAEKSEQ